ncbi:MAG: RDD family protein [Pseudomonadota bacterium]
MSEQQTDNPYETPSAPLVEETGEHELATLTERLAAAIIDGIIAIVITMPIYWFTDLWDRMMAGEQLNLTETVVMTAVGMVLFLLIHGYTLATRGQTLGKVVMRTRIVSNEASELLPLWRLVLLRYLPIWIVGAIPFAGSFFILLDSVFIFRKDRRCVHDFIAGTKVIKVR